MKNNHSIFVLIFLLLSCNAGATTFDAAVIGDSSSFTDTQLYGPGSGFNAASASAVLDRNTLTITAYGLLTISLPSGPYKGFPGGALVSTTDIFTGSWSNGAFYVVAGNSTVTGCTAASYSPSLCGSGTPMTTLGLTTSLIIDPVITPFPIIGLSTDHNASVEAHTTSFKSIYLLGPLTAVPTPGAVWLFSSGLIGLAGTTHKRKTA